MTTTWTVLIPVKRLEDAKSRLMLPPVPTRELVLAMLSDVVSAAGSEPRVRRTEVVTHDPDVARAAAALGADAWRVSGVHGLNDELAAAAARVPPTDGCCILMPDLAALSMDAFGGVLSAAPGSTAAFVPDLHGSGTTMLLSPGGRRVAPRFGERSAAAHRSIGFEIGEGAAPVQARLDVDHLVDLLTATQWGVGERTAAWLDRHRKLVAACLDRRPSAQRSEGRRDGRGPGSPPPNPRTHDDSKHRAESAARR